MQNDGFYVCSGRSQKVLKLISGLSRSLDAETDGAPYLPRYRVPVSPLPAPDACFRPGATATAQVLTSMYRLPTTAAIAAKPTANRANTASSSQTKYICSATTSPRNPHIHFRLLSLVFIFPLFPFPIPSNPAHLCFCSSTIDLDARPWP